MKRDPFISASLSGGLYLKSEEFEGLRSTRIALPWLPVEDLRVGYLISDLGQLSFTPDVEFRRFQFPATALSNNLAASASNRIVAQAELVSRYELSPQRDAVLVLRCTEISFDDLPAGVINPNSHGLTVLTGPDYSATVARFQDDARQPPVASHRRPM